MIVHAGKMMVTIQEARKVGADVGRGGGGTRGKEFIIGFLESAVDITAAKVREADSSAIIEMRREKLAEGFQKRREE
jgi:hypothetical protein